MQLFCKGGVSIIQRFTRAVAKAPEIKCIYLKPLSEHIDVLAPHTGVEEEAMKQYDRLTRSFFYIVSGSPIKLNEFPRCVLGCPILQRLTVPRDKTSHNSPPQDGR